MTTFDLTTAAVLLVIGVPVTLLITGIAFSLLVLFFTVLAIGVICYFLRDHIKKMKNRLLALERRLVS